MGGGGETSTTSNAYPPEITAAINNNVKVANQVASRPFTPYAKPFNGQTYLAANADVQKSYDDYLKGFKPGQVTNVSDMTRIAQQEYSREYAPGAMVSPVGGTDGTSVGAVQVVPDLQSYVDSYIKDHGTTGPSTPMGGEEFARQHWLNSGYTEGRAGGPEMRQRVAGLTTDQQSAAQLARTMAGSAVPDMGQGIAQEVGGYQPMMIDAARYGKAGQDISAYMNPYLDTAVNSALGDINRQGEAAGNAVRARMAGAGGFGGSRSAILEAETGRNYADAAARTSADMRNTGYWNAQGVAAQDANRMLSAETSNQSAGLQGAQLRLSAADQLMRSNQAGQQYQTNNINNLMGVGSLQQATNQADLDAQYAEFLRANGYPVEMLKARQIPLSMNLPTTQTTTGPGADNTGAIVGGVGAIAMAAATAF